MRLVLDDGELVTPDGTTLGRLVSMEIDVVPAPARTLTPTQVRQVECPFCKAAPSELCVRWRGGERKANHAERARLAFARSDTLSDDPGATGNFQSRDTTNELPTKAKEKSSSEDVTTVWEHYVETFGAARMKLDSTRTTIIRNALKVRTVEECKRAIDGLRISPFHNGENDRQTKYLGIQYALKGRNGESTDERIDKMIALAPLAPIVHGVADIKIERRIEVIRIWHRSGKTNEPRRAAQAIEDLKHWGFEVTLLDAPPYVQLKAKEA
ncbi:MAG: hypothetical protein NVS3B1_12680 [Marmoricola sp.]